MNGEVFHGWLAIPIQLCKISIMVDLFTIKWKSVTSMKEFLIDLLGREKEEKKEQNQ